MLQIYKPNAKVTGTACSFNYRNKTFGCSLIKQDGWNPDTKKGSFKANKTNPQATVNLKFNFTELGSLLDAIQNNKEVKLFHTFNGKSTSITFKPYIVEGVQRGYSFSISQKEGDQSKSFLIGFTPGEARQIYEYIKVVFSIHYSDIIRQYDVQTEATTTESADSSEIDDDPLSFENV